MSILRFVLLLFLLPSIAAAEKEGSASYAVSESSKNGSTYDEKVFTEVWEYRLLPNLTPGKAYEIRRTRHEQKITMTNEVSTPWDRKIEDIPKTFFTRHSFNLHPKELKGEGTGFGHIENQTSIKGPKMNRWPLFYTIKKQGDEYELETIVHMDEGKKMKIVERYEEDSFHFPSLKFIFLHDKDGNVLSAITYMKTLKLP